MVETQSEFSYLVLLSILGLFLDKALGFENVLDRIHGVLDLNDLLAVRFGDFGATHSPVSTELPQLKRNLYLSVTCDRVLVDSATIFVISVVEEYLRENS